MEYGGKNIPLKEIKGVRFGAINKVFKTVYYVDIKTNEEVIVIKTNKKVFDNFLVALGNAVSDIIIRNMLLLFRDGMDAGFGKNITDEGVHYVKSRSHVDFGYPQKSQDKNGEPIDIRLRGVDIEDSIDYGWNQVSIGFDGDNLCIYSPYGTCIYTASIVRTYNVLIFANIIRDAKENNVTRLSDLLNML